MSANENEEFALGENVTALAKSKSRGGSAVVAVRLSLSEFSEIESISRATGRSVSQVVREALRNWLHFDASSQPTVTISIKGGLTTTTGASRQQGQAVVVQTENLEPVRSC